MTYCLKNNSWFIFLTKLISFCKINVFKDYNEYDCFFN